MNELNEPLRRILYLSVARIEFDDEKLFSMLSQARMRNEASDVSGLLLFGDGSFLQVLEGPAENLAPIYQDICADPRHGSLLEIINEDIDRRVFADWSMGFVRADDTRMGNPTAFLDLRRDILTSSGFSGGAEIVERIVSAFLDRIPASNPR